MAPVDLVVATLAAVDVIAPAAQAKNITIKKLLGSAPQLVTADADRMQQIAWNVLSNAVKFTPSGGTISIRIEQEGGVVRLSISDTGKGITPEFLPFVFERFRQANSSVSRTEGGLGLGLSLARQLVELHGGQIEVSSDGRDRGTTFTIALPAISTDLADLPATDRSIDARALAGHRVLIVDDAADWRELLAEMLSKYGAAVTMAGSTAEALRAIERRRHTRPDLIVADIGLPGEDGFELIRRVRERFTGDERLPAIAVTGYSIPANSDKAIAAGFDYFRPKPIAPEAVIAMVIEALRLPHKRATQRHRAPGPARRPRRRRR